MVEVLKVVLPGWIIDRRPYRLIEDMMMSHSAPVEHGRDGALHRTRFLSFPIKADTPARHYLQPLNLAYADPPTAPTLRLGVAPRGALFPPLPDEPLHPRGQRSQGQEKRPSFDEQPSSGVACARARANSRIELRARVNCAAHHRRCRVSCKKLL